MKSAFHFGTKTFQCETNRADVHPETDGIDLGTSCVERAFPGSEQERVKPGNHKPGNILAAWAGGWAEQVE
ncbi:MAG: hypothetical protein U0R19_17465 [Bryobacteraceae bacterium]